MHSKTFAEFWWLTSGQDLARMLNEADYSEAARDAFLAFWRDVVCPQLGSGPGPTSGKSSISWDGNPFEYSFDLKGSTAKPKVRVCVDATQLRPGNPSRPLCTATTRRIIAWMRDHLAGFDETWSRALADSLVAPAERLPAEQQRALIARAGHGTSMILGVDVDDAVSAQGGLRAMGKVYFMPCLAAAAQGVSRFEAVRRAVLGIPGVGALPNVTAALGALEDFMAAKPPAWREGVRFLATDFVAPGRARLKIYLRCLAQDFEGLWDCYTLGGRIAGMDEDKHKIRDFVSLVSGRCEGDGDETRGPGDDHLPADRPGLTTVRKKASYLYYSLSADNPVPAPKIAVFSSLTAANDRAVVRGLDRWLDKYGWSEDGGKSMEERIGNSLTHRKLEEGNGIVTFFAIGRKEDPVKKGLSVQTYLTSELYDRPRIRFVDGMPVEL
ncbi:Tryptophan dimethylallyltransferase [Escovopsis weberi]|uniref:Tryptophan dimethylallyltransferase n=1 Tax=Escovopsis weberi TaxID=150374 RepID=A0A0M9VU56_ESCWE|nr:Tryptophan dimethylallyltransferase [Escovopsis weberi]